MIKFVSDDTEYVGLYEDLRVDRRAELCGRIFRSSRTGVRNLVPPELTLEFMFTLSQYM